MCDIKHKKSDERGFFQSLKLLYNLCMHISIISICFNLLKINDRPDVIQYSLVTDLALK
jgi:hypothetical protein